MSQQLLDALRARLLLDRLDRHLQRSPVVVAHCAGLAAFRGVPSWDQQLGHEPDRVALTVSGVVLLLDVAPRFEREVTVALWCREQSVETPWRFLYHPVPLVRLLSGRGVIASGPTRW